MKSGAQSPGRFVEKNHVGDRLDAGCRNARRSGCQCAAKSEHKFGRTRSFGQQCGARDRALLNENPNSNTPPPTDNGDVGTIWYSFDLTHKRIQEGGWTHQVTQRELPSSKDIAGVNMRLTAGSFRELHWHTAEDATSIQSIPAEKLEFVPGSGVARLAGQE
jgi:hypothetical protein